MTRRLILAPLLLGLACAAGQTKPEPPVVSENPVTKAPTTGLQAQVGPILPAAPKPLAVAPDALGFPSPEAAGSSFCDAMRGDPANFIHRFYAPTQLADDHFRCASRIFACGAVAKKAGRPPMSCSAGEYTRRGLGRMSQNLNAGLPKGVEMLSCTLKHVEQLRAAQGFFSKGDACEPSPDLRWARIDVAMEMRIDGRPQTKRFRARLVQLGAHGWFNFSH
ncbi:MAG: hypothetical protein CMH55_02205 [Myxococcales bacterium]|nr:hypothetical protein [Myxococcales bacterium]